MAAEGTGRGSVPAGLLGLVYRTEFARAGGQPFQDETSCLTDDTVSSEEDDEPAVTSSSGEWTGELLWRCTPEDIFELVESKRIDEDKASLELANVFRRTDACSIDDFLADLLEFLETIQRRELQRQHHPTRHDQEDQESHQETDQESGQQPRLPRRQRRRQRRKVESEHDEVERSAEGREKFVFDLIRKNCCRLGQDVVLLIAQRSLSLNYWGLVQVLAECRLITGHVCEELIHQMVQSGAADLMCFFVRHVEDMEPSYLLRMLRLILTGTGVSFEPVLTEWNRAANAAIAVAAKRHDHVNSGRILHANGNMGRQLRKSRKEAVAVRSALALAMAVDGFAAYELCLHDFLAADIDRAVVVYLVERLNLGEVLLVLRYLNKWVDKYNRRLANQNSPKGTKKCRIPTLPRILLWTTVLIDVHCQQFVTGGYELSAELRKLQHSIRELTDVSSKLSRLAGLTADMTSKCRLARDS